MEAQAPPLPRSVPLEAPQNGIAGLKHWRQDIVAGLMVSLVSLPLSLGIAVASGAEPITGLISAIIAGLIMPFLGGSFVTISGPAAGLAPVLYVGMAQLGQGDLRAGYPLLLAVICITGAVQVLLSLLKAARLSAIFPTAAVEGMLAAIGLLIIVKEIPHLLGVSFAEHDFFPMLLELPTRVAESSGTAVVIGLACLTLCFVLPRLKVPALAMVPPPLVVVAIGILLGWLLRLDEGLTIHVPDHVFAHGFVPPDFAQLFSSSALWGIAAMTVATLTMVDGVESLATAAAVDRIDPFRRKSQPNRVLFAMGISNMLSSVAGGLTIIPGGVKSKVCIMAGGRTLWANFYNALFLILYLSLASGLINLIPYSALAAVLIHTGYKMCEPRLWRHVAGIGPEQMLIFAATVIATLFTDLLWGILAGIGAKLLINTLCTWPAKDTSRRRGSWPLAHVADLFRNPVTRRESTEDVYEMYFGKPLVCFNAVYVNKELQRIPPTAHNVVLHITDQVTLIDHTTCDNLLRFAGEQNRREDCHVEIVGLEQLASRTTHEASLRYARSTARRGNRVVRAAQRVLLGSNLRAADRETSPHPARLKPR